MDNVLFQKIIEERGSELFRSMPWRLDTSPYYILVSEMMLQQTQVDRVVPKFREFVRVYPDVESLAKAPLDDVLRLWSGLGYNRRAKYLHDSAVMIVDHFKGVFPSSKEVLLQLPGVGVNTAGAILVYAFNHPVVFIETNVRTVYFHHFFHDEGEVSDQQLKELVSATVDKSNPRLFYWAVMDYGAWLKRTGKGNIAKSAHYRKQAPLRGSVREVRGMILKKLGEKSRTEEQLREIFKDDPRVAPALQGLSRDGLIEASKGVLHLTK